MTIPMTRKGLRATHLERTRSNRLRGSRDAPQAMEAIKSLNPDLVLMDLTLPGKSGLELIKDLKVMHPKTPILVLSMHDETLYAERVLRAGAGGYINKQQRPEVLLAAIRDVLVGRTYVSQQLSEKILKQFSGRPVAPTSPLEILTDREFEVFRLVGEGETTVQIAKRLSLSAKTVAVHYANIRRKLQIGTYSDLIRFAVRLEEGRT